MYGMLHTRKITHNGLLTHLKPFGYKQWKYTLGLWTNTKKGLTFTLVVDYFSIKYKTETQAQHLIDTLKTKYEVSEDWTGGLYIGIFLKWNYNKRTCNISIPNYVSKALEKLNFQLNKTKVHTLKNPYLIKYGSKT